MNGAGLYRRATAVALVVAPLLFLADNLIHPKELARGNEAEQLRVIGEHYTRWQLAHAVGFAAILVFAAAVLGLAYLVRRRQPRLGLAAGAAAVVGLIGLGAAITIDGFTWGILGESAGNPEVGRQAAAAVLHDVQHSEWSLIYYLTAVGFIFGLVALAIGAIREGAVQPWAGALLALAAVMTGAETAIVSNVWFIAGAVVLVLGGGAVAASVARMTDEEFAAGGPRQP
jgi:uncharacterized protein DUF4386